MGCTAELAVLQYHTNVYDNFTFHWTKEGSRHPVNQAENDTPNILSFLKVSEKEFGFYRCEVKEAGKVVFIAYRGLYRDDSGKSSFISV